MATNPRRTNGHRRRELKARVFASEDRCALCDEPVDKALSHLDDRGPVLDEDVPIARGGSPYERANVHLMHRACNQWKRTMTLAEARAARHRAPSVRPVVASPIW
jgi:hypothetical protein